MPPPPHAEKRDPPPYRKNIPHMERMYTHSAHIEEKAPIGEKKPPIQFFIHAPPPTPPGERQLFLPLATADHELYSLKFVPFV